MRPVFVLACIFLSGCSLDSRLPVHKPNQLPLYYSEVTGSVRQSTDQRWWNAFRDPILDRLINDGLANNIDVRTAMLRIDAAQQNIIVAGSGGLPAINFDMSHVRSRETGRMKEIPGIVDNSMRGASATWLIDIFGEVRSQMASARATRNATVEAASIARLALLSDIAVAYMDVRYYQELMAIGERAVASRQQALALTRQLAAQGVASELDVSRSEEIFERIRADLPNYDANFRRAAHRVSTLMGVPATAALPFLQQSRSQPSPAFDPAIGVPADLLRNRPDVRKAEQEFVAAVADIGFARAQLFPTITLSGTITSSFISTDLKSGSLNKWSFGPSLRLPIFEGGKLRANVKIAASQAQQKELAWRGAVLKAVEEVENALVSYNRSRAAIVRLQSRVNAIEKAVRLSTSAFEAGMSSRLEALDAARELYEAQTDLALEKRNLAVNFVALNVAVGRGLPGPGRSEMGCMDRSCAVASIEPRKG